MFSALNSATALRHALEHAAAARDRVGETLSKLDVEDERCPDRSASASARNAPPPAEGLRRAHDAIEATRIAHAARESSWPARTHRARMAVAIGPLPRARSSPGSRPASRSLEELDAARAGYGDAARTVLVQANGKVSQQGAIADYLEVEAGTSARSKPASAICSSMWSSSGRSMRPPASSWCAKRGAGRCGFLVTEAAAPAFAARSFHASMSVTGDVSYVPPPDVPPVDRSRRASWRCRRSFASTGRLRRAIRQAVGEAGVATTCDEAASASRLTPLPIATLDGDVFRGPHIVSGGGRAESRGILETKREIKELRERIAADRQALMRLAQGDGGARGDHRSCHQRDRRAERRAPQAGQGRCRIRRAAAARDR